MNCAWNELLAILPSWMRDSFRIYAENPPCEIRMRANSPPELIFRNQIFSLKKSVTEEDIRFCINTASRYSPWLSSSVSHGYLTAPGGHRIGLCGEALIKDGIFCGLQSIRSICIRIAKDIRGIADSFSFSGKSVLILGAPGWGKTTLLRDLSRKIAASSVVSVIDERKELFPVGFQPGKRMDILSGCPKTTGIMTVLRTMGPEYIAVDEITEGEDCLALVHAAHCGVHLLSTAHASGLEDFVRRPLYQPLLDQKVFDTFIVLRKDMSFSVEAL